MPEYLHMKIDYSMKDDSYIITGDLDKRGQIEILENFLRSQMGLGKMNAQRINWKAIL